MDDERNDEMQLISKVAEATGISVNTLRFWARTGQMPAELLPTMIGPAWHTTIRDALEAKRTRKPRGRRKQ